MDTLDIPKNEGEKALAHVSSFNSDYDERELLLVPDNYAEILIPISEGIKVRIIGTAKFVDIKPNNAYFLTPRRRGMEINLDSKASFLLVKINPIYTKQICEGLKEIATGIFDLGITYDVFSRLKLAWVVSDKNVISNWVEKDILKKGEEKLDSTVEESISQIKDAGGSIKVKDLYTNLNISKSKLEKHFNKELKMTPKEFCRIEKINCFIKTYQQEVSQNLTELTYKCGYYDQSHLIKDFRYFLDVSPKKYFTLRNPSLHNI